MTASPFEREIQPHAQRWVLVISLPCFSPSCLFFRFVVTNSCFAPLFFVLFCFTFVQWFLFFFHCCCCNLRYLTRSKSRSIPRSAHRLQHVCLQCRCDSCITGTENTARVPGPCRLQLSPLACIQQRATWVPEKAEQNKQPRARGEGTIVRVCVCASVSLSPLSPSLSPPLSPCTRMKRNTASLRVHTTHQLPATGLPPGCSCTLQRRRAACAARHRARARVRGARW